MENKELILELKEAILDAMQNCGRESTAAKQVFDDNGLPFNLDTFEKALALANQEWKKTARFIM